MLGKRTEGRAEQERGGDYRHPAVNHPAVTYPGILLHRLPFSYSISIWRSTTPRVHRVPNSGLVWIPFSVLEDGRQKA